MSAPHDDDARKQRQLPKNRFRLVFIGTVIVILVVVFGYMLLISATR